jgi:hypothetical protein
MKIDERLDFMIECVDKNMIIKLNGINEYLMKLRRLHLIGIFLDNLSECRIFSNIL